MCICVHGFKLMPLVNLKISALPNSKKFDRPYVCINILHNMNMKCIYVPIYKFLRQRHRTIFTSIGLTLKWPWICGGNDPVKNATKNRVYKKFLTIFTEIYRQTQRFRFRCCFFFFFKLLCRAMRLRDRQKKLT